MKPSHMLICLLLVVAGVTLALTGAGGVAIVPVVACVVMMGAMMWMMAGSGGHGGQ